MPDSGEDSGHHQYVGTLVCSPLLCGEEGTAVLSGERVSTPDAIGVLGHK